MFFKLSYNTFSSFKCFTGFLCYIFSFKYYFEGNKRQTFNYDYTSFTIIIFIS